MAKTKFSYNKNVSVMRVVGKLLVAIIGLYVGGTLVQEFGAVMNSTCSPFYKGLTLIGWTTETGTGAGNVTAGCVGNLNTITDTSGSGILVVIGLIAIASIVLEFVKIERI